MRDLFILITSLLLTIAIAYGGWRLIRWANWTFDYDDRVEEMIETQVKPECLL